MNIAIIQEKVSTCCLKARIFKYKKVLLFFSWESDYDMFFNFAFYQKHLEFALYLVFWVHTSKFYFMPHCHICFRRQFLTPLPFQNLTQVHNFHNQDIYIINFQGNSDFFILTVAFRFRRGNQSLIFFYLLPQLISFMTELLETLIFVYGIHKYLEWRLSFFWRGWNIDIKLISLIGSFEIEI